MTDGFWAASRDQELPNPGLTVAFLVRMEEVTAIALKGMNDSKAERNGTSSSGTCTDIKAKATEGNGYISEVKSFFFGNRYFLFVYEVFTDVRLVGAPPNLSVNLAVIRIIGFGPGTPAIFRFFGFMPVRIISRQIIHPAMSLTNRPNTSAYPLMVLRKEILLW